ncbi:E3 SUMO-protein ligase ZBED1-like [Ischnura elegans]|uniref:E3 SUMO-protein ligase ZBED1-like n=1 Tax=Ischnura elegans TaxID=197161 RepID=UPI001ED8B21C|nr:E3 SUMO-protein ligase ZBED1-like [Ischnura elegans]
MEKRKRSLLWTSFTDMGSGKAKCGLCGQVMSFLGGATSNLRRHLKFKHPGSQLSRQDIPPEINREELIDISALRNSQDSSSSVPPCPDVTPDQAPGVIPMVLRAATNQPRITNYINKPISQQRHKQLDHQLIKMIAKEYHPLSLVEDKEFKNFVYLLNPNYKLPSRKTVSSTLVPQLYLSTKEMVLNTLRSVHSVSITTDAWTSINNDSFLAVTVHFQVGCDLKSYLLDCFELTGKHTSENLAAEIIRIATEWEVVGKISVVVSDNAANIKAAIKKCHWRHIPCFAHTINLIVKAGVQEISALQIKVKQIVEFFKRRPDATAKLRALQKQSGVSELKLKQEVPTRWNSTYDMFQRMIALR